MKSDSDLQRRVEDLIRSGASRRELLKSSRALGISIKKLWKILSVIEDRGNKDVK